MASQRKLHKDEQDLAMEDAISLILRGCSLARELEFNVLNSANNIHFPQPQMVARSCDQILSVFSAAKDRLSGCERPPLTAVLREVGLEDWLRSSQAMDQLAQMQMRSPPPPPPSAVEDSGKLVGMGFGSSSSSSTKPRRRY